jgi:hypothetical protein
MNPFGAIKQNEEMPESISSFRLEKENMKKHGNVKN